MLSCLLTCLYNTTATRKCSVRIIRRICVTEYCSVLTYCYALRYNWVLTYSNKAKCVDIRLHLIDSFLTNSKLGICTNLDILGNDSLFNIGTSLDRNPIHYNRILNDRTLSYGYTRAYNWILNGSVYLGSLSDDTLGYLCRFIYVLRWYGVCLRIYLPTLKCCFGKWLLNTSK